MAWTLTRPGVALSRTRSVATVQTMLRLLLGITILIRHPQNFLVIVRCVATSPIQALIASGDGSGSWSRLGLPHLREYLGILHFFMQDLPLAADVNGPVAHIGVSYFRFSAHTNMLAYAGAHEAVYKNGWSGVTGRDLGHIRGSFLEDDQAFGLPISRAVRNRAWGEVALAYGYIGTLKGAFSQATLALTRFRFQLQKGPPRNPTRLKKARRRPPRWHRPSAAKPSEHSRTTSTSNKPPGNRVAGPNAGGRRFDTTSSGNS